MLPGAPGQSCQVLRRLKCPHRHQCIAQLGLRGGVEEILHGRQHLLMELEELRIIVTRMSLKILQAGLDARQIETFCHVQVHMGAKMGLDLWSAQ